MPSRPPESALSRRDWLAGVSATAVLTACGAREGTTADGPDGAGSGLDGATVVPGQDAQPLVDTALGADATATDLGADVSATDLGADASTTDAAADSAAEVAGGVLPINPITANDKFYITSCCETPVVDASTWTLTISDRGKLLGTIDMAFLESLQPSDKEHTLECIGGGPAYPLISNAIWTGLPLLKILAAKGIQVPSDVSEMKITALDDFSTGLPTSDLPLPIWLVWRVNGAPLPAEHGFPARLLVPNRYGMKNPKWIKALEFVSQPYIGFWESQGWSKTAYYRPNAYIHGPKPSTAPKAGKILVFGTAFAGRDQVVKVDVRIDGGTWQPAVLDYYGVQDVWTLWHFDWLATSGLHSVQARCTTASGATSVENPEGTDTLSGYNGSMAISLTVA